MALSVAAACAGDDGGGPAPDAPEAGGEPRAAARGHETATPTSAPPARTPLTRPDWLGTRVLEEAPGRPPPVTPAELDPRRLPTVEALPAPPDGGFQTEIAAVPEDVAARSTWREGCPVGLDELRYVTVSFWGFDDLVHTGEMLVHRDAAAPVAQVFERLFAMRFPIEEMHVTTVAELDAPNTGDGNATAAFVCRPTRGRTSWSQHAYGLAVDINPFQNPYVRDDVLTPGLASTYLDRADVRPGMVVPGGGVIEAFADIGWEWGGTWGSPVDYMHFSATGR